MKLAFNTHYILAFFILLFIAKSNNAQVDSMVKKIVDTVVNTVIVDDIPRKTINDKLMYPHRWYVKQLLKPKPSAYDTSYIMSNKKKLTITIPITKKFYGFTINDLTEKRKLQFAPNTYYYVGFNFSNIILTFGFTPAVRFGAKPDRGKTINRDLQVTLIGRRVITDVNFQNYKGFYLFNSKEYYANTLTTEAYNIRPDIKVFSFGINTMFIHNHRKYSLRGAFSFADVQRKSAGSFMSGIYHSHVLFTSRDSTFAQHSLSNFFSPTLYSINKISVITVGLSGGYGYTYVFKKIIYSSVINIGLGAQKTNYTTLDGNGHTLSINPSFHINAKATLRYDNLRYFAGILASYDNKFTYNPTLFNTENYIAKIVCFVGYRFNIKQNGRKVLKAMKLVDYDTK